MRRSAAFVSPFVARLIGFVVLGGLAVLEWRRMVEATSAGRALLWLAAALAAVGLLRLIERRGRPAARPLVAVGGTGLAVAASGMDLGLLRPSRWPELGEGLMRGAEALGSVRLPYRGVDPWPGETLELFGALLIVAAALLAFWPRGDGRHGHAGSALVLLLVMVISPITALSTPAPLALGAVVALGTACFLFLERLPVRPGPGVAALAAGVLAVALPLGAAADREEPLFDYRTFAETLGPGEPVRFSWEHGYGPIDWPRDGRELFRVRADEPFYWKAQSLPAFDGERWRTSGDRDPDGDDPRAELADVAAVRGAWDERVEITLRRLQTDTLVGPGTILGIEAASRGVAAEWVPSRWITSRDLGRGDSYTVTAHVPRPAPEQLATANAGWDGRQSEALELTLPVRADALPGAPQLPPGVNAAPQYADEVTLRFGPFGAPYPPSAHYDVLGVERDGVEELRRTHYWRTYRLAQRLRREATSAWDYVLAVNAHLRSAPFRYTETPPPPAPGVPPLVSFLHDTRAGYCQHFSGAMALLLRMGGVPARVATGFSPGGLRRRRGEWIVRDIDAHSWVEAWFDDAGWVTVDPTPPATPARSQTAALDPPEDEDESAGTSAAGGADPAVPERRDPEGSRREPEVTGTTAPAGDSGPPWAPGVALALASIAAVGMARRRRRRRPALAAGDALLLELERALRRSGRPPRTAVTLTELERRLGGSAYLRALRTARYGGRPTAPTAAERAQFRRDLAAGLGWTGRLRALYALPPRWHPGLARGLSFRLWGRARPGPR